jgi:uncharacterized protein (TIGR03084 family)
MPDVAEVLRDLAAESSDLEALLAARPDRDWRRATPAEGWTVADQIGHLTWTDEVALLSATDADAFAAALHEALREFDGYIDRVAAERATQAPQQLRASWRAGRAALADALAAAPAGHKLPWFGPPMSPTSMATARLMETWAHGQDVADALGVPRPPTDRLRHIAHIGVRTRDFAYLARDRTPPSSAFRVEVTGPGGDTWTWGPNDAAQRVTGPALDFCLLVTQRRHRDDLALVATGNDADEWLDIAQAFAGPPGTGRKPGQFA